MKIGLLAVSFMVLLLLSTANASLTVSVTVEKPEINQGETQRLTVTTNDGGIGFLLVLQPANGTPWVDFLEDHPALKALWDKLPNNTRAWIADKIGEKIVSFAIVRTGACGGNVTVTFPQNFTGINGDPNTQMIGEYKAILAFISFQKPDNDDEVKCCCHFEVDFDCVSWPVIPEFPSAPLLMIFFAAITLSMIELRRKKRL